MYFKIASPDNNSTFGNLFFSVPVEAEMHKAETSVSEICYKRATQLYKNNLNDVEAMTFDRIKKEIKKMCDTETVFHFLIIKEIAEISKKIGYPIRTEGNLSGSIISYLLGITEYDPLSDNVEYNSIELLWGTDETMLNPNFSIGISPQIRPFISNILDSKYGHINCDDNLCKQFSLTDVNMCERLGTLFKMTGKRPFYNDYTEKVYTQVVENIADEYVRVSENFQKEGNVFDDNQLNIIPFINELKKIPPCNFEYLIRVYAYLNCSITYEKRTVDLSNKNFFVTRNEFFRALTNCNIPYTIALDIVKNGVWSTNKKRAKYTNILESYNVPEYICEYFSNITHLWEQNACISRLLLECALAWYQINYPNLFKNLDE